MTSAFAPLPHCDFTPLVREALSDPACRCLTFQPGRYDFHPAFAEEKYLFVSNNDEGLKRIAFPLFDREGFEVEAQGAHFVFHGGLVPFALSGCVDVRLRGFSINWDVPFHGEAEVLAADAAGVDLRIAEGFRYRVMDGHLQFGTEPFEIKNILAFDAERRETAFLTHDNYGIGTRCVARETGPGLVRLDAALSQPLPTPGNILALMGERRDYPAIVLATCEGVEIEDVTLLHAGGMGVIAQCSVDLTLRRITVAPAPGRMISTTADATHFVNCGGKIHIEDCRFENQMDDAVNIHGIYAELVERTAAGTVVVRIRHHQQFGVPLAGVGDRMEFIDGHSLTTWHEAEVTAVTSLNKEYVRLTLDPPPLRAPAPGDVLGNRTWNPDVEIRGCRSRGNRARGFLLSVAGKIVVEDNEFHTPGAAILIAGDALDWFESGAVRDVLIRGNRFVNCNYGVWGRAVIQVFPQATTPQGDQARYHRNIRVINNEFQVFDPRLVFARNVDGLEFTGNRVRRTTDYPSQHAGAPALETASCLDVQSDYQDEPSPQGVPDLASAVPA